MSSLEVWPRGSTHGKEAGERCVPLEGVSSLSATSNGHLSQTRTSSYLIMSATIQDYNSDEELSVSHQCQKREWPSVHRADR